MFAKKIDHPLRESSEGMGKKQFQKVKQRYLTDIVSRWKESEGEIQSYRLQARLQEFQQISQATVTEYTHFEQAVEDALFETETKFYKEQIHFGHETLASMRTYVEHNLTHFQNLIPRLREVHRAWQQDHDDRLFETQIQIYERLLLDNEVTLDDLYNRVEADVQSRTVKRRLYSTIELWARTQKGPVNSLDRLAKDSQNIHTFAVVQATNTSLAVLQAISVPPNQKTLQEIQAAWYTLGHIDHILEDIRVWANKEPNYRSLLRSVWAKIQQYSTDVKQELIKRLYEESLESVGMCAQGHISRLTNVFTGFDERFVQSESLQDRMAALAISDRTEEQKRTEAHTILEEMQVPIHSRQAWLDAF